MYRFTLNVGPVSSIVISNQLNDVNIVKMFPNMDVHVAFAFVLNAEVTKRCVDSNCLAQETQVTQSILCNLLDVIGEVQMAQIEIGNLIQTNFHSQSGQQLNLQLCFISFQTGIKVTLTLDVTCLKRYKVRRPWHKNQIHSWVKLDPQWRILKSDIQGYSGSAGVFPRCFRLQARKDSRGKVSNRDTYFADSPTNFLGRLAWFPCR
ncbi:hypothetical protein TIFTF001_001702 [Ficus carica]|uniref:Uncharacterized protein n=1 Tax=Ficus carica TaxID=3494 RepID=A0AA88CS97_FICCA|nr:hypothetical protein TIFTF001_001702 [Ficus carica]